MKIWLLLSLIFAPDTLVATPMAGKLEVQGSYQSCKQVESGLRERFKAEGVKIIQLECQQMEASK